MNAIPSKPSRLLGAALSFALGGMPDYGVAGADSCPDAGTDDAPCLRRVVTPSLALARVYRPGMDLNGYWVSEKLDGIRAYWDGSRLLSRRGNPIQAPAWFTEGLPSFPLDGELWLGRGRFQELMSTVRDRRPDEAAWRAVRYRVFDLPGSPLPFGARRAELQRLLDRAVNPYAEPVAQQRLGDPRALQDLLKQVTKAGGEGLMLRRDDAPYRAGRSDDLLKLKLRLDAEARVLAHLPGRGKYLGMMGSLLVEDEQGRQFRIGTGFSDAERREPPPVGSIVTFKFQGRTDRGIPRFASYWRPGEGF
jgi:DNA ligase-1